MANRRTVRAGQRSRNPEPSVPPRLAAFWLGYHSFSLPAVEIEGLAALTYLEFDGSALLQALEQFDRSVRRLAEELPAADHQALSSLAFGMHTYWLTRLRGGQRGGPDNDASPARPGDADDSFDAALERAWADMCPSAQECAGRLIDLTRRAVGTHATRGPWYRVGVAFGRLHLALFLAGGPDLTEVVTSLRALSAYEQRLVPCLERLITQPRPTSPVRVAQLIRDAAIRGGQEPRSRLPVDTCWSTVALDALPHLVAGIASSLQVAAPRLGSLRPHWDTATLTLYLGEAVVHKFRDLPGGQVSLLEAFAEDEWPESIPNPFRSGACADDRKLTQTVKDLNKNTRQYIWFHSQRMGFVSWDIL